MNTTTTPPTWTLDTTEARVALREAIQACNERGLYSAARWAAEALTGLPLPEDVNSGRGHTTSYREDLALGSDAASNDADLMEHDAYLMAKSFFDLKEYDRCASVLEGYTSNKSRFLRLYSRYLVMIFCLLSDLFGPLDHGMAVNKELESLDSELTEAYKAGTLDAFCKYLYGVVLIKRLRKTVAATILIESVKQYPYNWSAWLDLGSCLPSYTAVKNILLELPASFMTTFFLTHVTLEYFGDQHEEDFPEAAKVFEELVKENPHRLDGLDVFSNVLFVTDSRARLSFLAHACAETDIYRPETCCIIGNYYSMKAEHEKAVTYFKKALRLNRSYASAWTLLGHEYLEMKNTFAAVESYRRAVDYNQRDYRAWNGLGQTYEALKMHYYSLNYYQRATAIRPYDGRIWCAMAECYEYLDQDSAAIKCYTRALLGSDQEKMALKKLPKLYKKIGDKEAAAYYFRKSLEQLREEQSESEDTSEACLFLALYE
ncbi:anaphase-promoting complex component apc8, partial [Mortierella sp. NVP85]